MTKAKKRLKKTLRQKLKQASHQSKLWPLHIQRNVNQLKRKKKNEY